jgi:hypothetical protein
MLALGTLLLVVLTFVAALIAGVGVLTALVVVAVMTVALLLSHRRSAGRDVGS